MLRRIVKMSKMSYLNIYEGTEGVSVSFVFVIKVPQRGSSIKIWRVKCNGKCLKQMADASDCALAYITLT